MRISLWQQFSSNHSGNFRVVGCFDTPEAAQHAAATVLDLLTEIKTWHQQGFGWDEQLSPPEVAYRERTGVKWENYDYSLYDPYTYQEALEQAVIQWDNLLFVRSKEETHRDPSSYYALIEQLGGKAVIDWKYHAFVREVTVTLTCTAPDLATATEFYEDIYEELEELGEFDEAYLGVGGPHVVVNGGKITQEQERLTLTLRFAQIEQDLPELVEHLARHGYTEIAYHFEEDEPSV